MNIGRRPAARIGWTACAALALALSACGGGEGGELREATERRRAQQASADTMDDAARTAVAADTGYEVPAFLGGDTAAAPGGTDTASAAATDTTPDAPAAEEWTAGVRDVRRRPSESAVVRDVRLGGNVGFDRVVIELARGEIPGYHVEYVDRPVRQCGSGDETEIAGDAWLAIRLEPAQAHDNFQPTVRQRERRVSMEVVREMEFTCDFEGQVEIVLGVATPNRYRVTELQNPSRLIVDIQH